MNERYRSGRSPLRALWIALVTLVILAVPAYGIVTLLPPLPAGRVVQVAFTTPTTVPPADFALPTEGSSAVADASGTVLQSAGGADARPMAGAAKTVLALVALQAKPLAASATGDPIAIQQSDVDAVTAYAARGARTVPVTLGDTWTERELLTAVVLGSANNLTETLQRWAFGGEGQYVTAARAWLAANKLTGTTVVDGDGLDAKNVSTASDLAKLAQLAYADPAMASILSRETTNGQRPIDDYIAYRAIPGVQVVSRGYTDSAGVCLLIALQPTGTTDADARLYVSMFGQSSYPALSSALDAVVQAVPEATKTTQLLDAGAAVARYETSWGQKTDLVLRRPFTTSSGGEVAVKRLAVPPLGSTAKGTSVGTAVFEVGGTSAEFALVAASRLDDPGLTWRVGHPATMLRSFFSMF